MHSYALSKLERSTTKCPKCQSASEAISQIEELENQVRDLTSSHESKGGEASLDMTQWASVRAFDRARLWRETLASLTVCPGDDHFEVGCSSRRENR